MAPPVKYDPRTTMALICAKMIQGSSLRQICREEGMPSKLTVLRWLDDEANVVLRTQYMRAREALGDEFNDMIVDVAFDDADDPNNKRVKMDALKWQASRLNPKRYGDRLTQQHVGPNDGPVQHEDVSGREVLTERLAGLAARTAPKLHS